jgi:hypothetical protein
MTRATAKLQASRAGVRRVASKLLLRGLCRREKCADRLERLAPLLVERRADPPFDRRECGD